MFIEPQALRQFLHLKRVQLPSPETRRDLRVLLRSYGLEPSSGEKRLIFKLNSLAVHSLAAIRAALPEVAFIYMLRDPAEVVASISRATPAFLRPENRASLAEMIGLDPSVTADSGEQWWSRYVEWNLSLAYRHERDFTLAVDYRDFATRYLAVARRWSDRTLANDDPEVVESLAFHSKKPGVRFSPTAGAVSPGVSAIAAGAYLRWSQRLREEEFGTPRRPGPMSRRSASGNVWRPDVVPLLRRRNVQGHEPRRAQGLRAGSASGDRRPEASDRRLAYSPSPESLVTREFSQEILRQHAARAAGDPAPQ